VHKTVTLKIAARYSKKRVCKNDVSLETFITTDNLLPGKMGVGPAVSLPPQDGAMPGYEEGNILVSNIRPYLKKIWLANRCGGCSADVLVFDAKEPNHPEFIYYTMFRDLFFEHMMRGSKGTKMPRGDKTQIMDFKIPDVAPQDQKKIAAVLSALDAKIELNNRINAELEAMAKTLYDYWFVQFDFPDAKGRPYQSSGGKMVYNSALKRKIPEGWGDGSLWDIADYFNGLAMQKHRPTGTEALRVIKIKEMNEGFSASTEFASPDIPAQAIVQDGDVLFSWSASLDVKIWSQGIGALNQHIFKVTSAQYPKSFYYFELRNYLTHFKMMAEKRKTTMGHITQDHLKQSRIVLPPLPLINKVEEAIKPMLTQQQVFEKQTQQLSSLRDWLLPMLMNGQVQVRDNK